MNRVSLTPRYEVTAWDNEDGVWDAFLHDDDNKTEPLMVGDGDCYSSAVAMLFINFTDSALTLPADAFVPFRAEFLKAVDALGKKAAKRCGVKS